MYHNRTAAAGTPGKERSVRRNALSKLNTSIHLETVPVYRKSIIGLDHIYLKYVPKIYATDTFFEEHAPPAVRINQQRPPVQRRQVLLTGVNLQTRKLCKLCDSTPCATRMYSSSAAYQRQRGWSKCESGNHTSKKFLEASDDRGNLTWFNIQPCIIRIVYVVCECVAN